MKSSLPHNMTQKIAKQRIYVIKCFNMVRYCTRAIGTRNKVAKQGKYN